MLTTARRLAATRYAVVAVSAADRRPDGPVYGVGATQEAAESDAAEWTEDVSGCETYPITDALAAEVEARGGDLRYGFQDGTLCTEAEADAFLDAMEG